MTLDLFFQPVHFLGGGVLLKWFGPTTTRDRSPARKLRVGATIWADMGRVPRGSGRGPLRVGFDLSEARSSFWPRDRKIGADWFEAPSRVHAARVRSQGLDTTGKLPAPPKSLGLPGEGHPVPSSRSRSGRDEANPNDALPGLSWACLFWGRRKTILEGR